MHSLIRKCTKDGHYTMKDTCPICGTHTEFAIPSKYSPSDRFQKFRLKIREAEDNGKNSDKSI